MRKLLYILLLFGSIVQAQNIALISNSKNETSSGSPTVNGVMSGFEIINTYPSRVYFDTPDGIATGIVKTDFTITGKTIDNVVVENSSGGYFTVTVPFTFWDNNTIRKEGTGTVVRNFTLQYITNKITEPAAADHTFYVDGSVAVSGNGLTEINAFKTIGEGITAIDNEATPEGSTLYIKAYDYGAVTVSVGSSGTSTKPIKFIGYNNAAKNVELTFSQNLVPDATVMPYINGGRWLNAGSGGVGNDFIIMKNIQVRLGNRASSGSANYVVWQKFCEYVHIENVYSYDGSHGIFNERRFEMAKALRIKRCFTKDMGATGIGATGEQSMITDCYATTSQDVGQDYYIINAGAPLGGQYVMRNNTIVAYDLDSHGGHGISFKSDEDALTGNTITYSLMEGNYVNNPAQAVELRHQDVEYCVVRGNTVLHNGTLNDSHMGIQITSAQNNTIENNFFEFDYTTVLGGYAYGIRWLLSTGEDITAPDGGNNNLFRNNIWIYRNTSRTNASLNYYYSTAAPNNNTLLNNTVVGFNRFLVNGIGLTGVGNTMINTIIEDVPTAPSGTHNWSFSGNDFFNTGTWADSYIGSNDNFDQDPDLNTSFVPQTTFSLIDIARNSDAIEDANGSLRKNPTTVGAKKSTNE